jgi:hypothetical protein
VIPKHGYRLVSLYASGALPFSRISFLDELQGHLIHGDYSLRDFASACIFFPRAILNC